MPHGSGHDSLDNQRSDDAEPASPVAVHGPTVRRAAHRARAIFDAVPRTELAGAADFLHSHLSVSRSMEYVNGAGVGPAGEGGAPPWAGDPALPSSESVREPRVG